MALPPTTSLKAIHGLHLLGRPRRKLGEPTASDSTCPSRELATASRALVHTEAVGAGYCPDPAVQLFSEEIPARMPAKAADYLRPWSPTRLPKVVVYDGAKAFADTARLTLTVHGNSRASVDLKERTKGPRVAGRTPRYRFFKATGLASLDEARVQRDRRRAILTSRYREARPPTLDVLADMLP